MYHTCRKGRGGGVAIYIDNKYETIRRSEFECKDQDICESLFLEVKIANQTYIMGTIYRPPKSNYNLFFNYLVSLSEHNLSNKKLIITGDYNIDLLQKDNNSLSFRESFSSIGLTNLVNEATRSVNNSATCIDNILYSLGTSFAAYHILPVPFSDHSTIDFSFTLPNSRNTHPLPFITNQIYLPRKINQHRLDRAGDFLNGSIWSDLYDCQNVNQALSIFLEIIYKNLYFPLKLNKLKMTAKNGISERTKPWITEAIKQSISIKKNLYKNYLKNPNEESLNMFKKQRNLLTDQIRSARRSYISKMVIENSNNPKTLWKWINNIIQNKYNCKNSTGKHNRINNILIDEIECQDPQKMANHFNNHFINIPSTLHTKLQNESPTNIHSTPIPTIDPPDTMTLQKIIEGDILRNIKDLKSSDFTDTLGLSSNILKKLSSHIITPLCYLINLSFSSGSFPDLLKEAIITPIHKKGPKNVTDNYRPITVLPVLSKLFEKIFL